MYILLTGAFKNAGDYLIGERAKALLKKHRKDRELVELSRNENLDKHLDLINSAKAVILCGGPAYQKDFYPKIYPLTSDPDAIKVPIVPMGLGAYHKDKEIDNFEFAEKADAFLKKIHSNIKYSSCRDVLTEKALRKHGVENVLMTGCPAWYHIPSIGKEFSPTKIKKVAFSSGAYAKLFKQNVDIMKRLKEIFPNAEFYSVFHRGTGKDKFTGIRGAWFLKRLVRASKNLGYEIIDASYGTKNLKIYEEVDLHVGYRVHAHIYMLSQRKPTFLIQEDGRGCGVSRSLELTNDVWAYDKGAVTELMVNIRREAERNFAGFEGLGSKIDKHYERMVDFIKSLP